MNVRSIKNICKELQEKSWSVTGHFLVLFAAHIVTHWQNKQMSV